MNVRTTAWLAASLGLVSASACSSSQQGKSAPDPTVTTSTELHTNRHADTTILPRLPAEPTVTQSTVPGNGDVNPYGVAFVPPGFPTGGALKPGDIVVANFNNVNNTQGTGTTIVRFRADESPALFFEDANAAGLSTALGVLERGYVLVGNVPSTNGSGVCTEGPKGEMENVGQGALRILDRNGNLVRKLASAAFLDGPWDLTLDDRGSSVRVYVSNVLSGTVTRIDLALDEGDCDSHGNPRIDVVSETQIASGYLHRCDPSAFVVGPTGLALDPDRDVIYVASTGDNIIYAVDGCSHTRDRGKGRPVVTDTEHLHGPLGLVRAANGDLISAQGDAVNFDPNQPSEIVEFTAGGRFVDQFSIDPAPGSAFGVALDEKSHGAFDFAAVDDGLNVLDVWNVR
jgi:DNA-binding beta-propeller fold protein YncE